MEVFLCGCFCPSSSGFHEGFSGRGRCVAFDLWPVKGHLGSSQVLFQHLGLPNFDTVGVVIRLL